MRLLLFNLATDRDDAILGFTTRWLWALAERVKFIHVITMRAGHLDLPDNVRVYSVGKEKGHSEIRRCLKFYQLLFRVLGEDKIDACFSHMMPLFTVLAGPVLKTKKIPIVTWFAHPNLTWTLRLAHRLSDRMVASVATAYPYKKDKLTVVGQGIDTELFSPGEPGSQTDPAVILCVGRLSPVKDHPTLLKAVSLLRRIYDRPFRVTLVGAAAAARDESYVRSLHAQIKELGLEQIVDFEPAVAMEKLPFWYRRCSVLANMTPTGSGDKVVFEAMACAKPCLVASEGFRQTLGAYADRLMYSYGDPKQLAERLLWTMSMSDIARADMGAYLRRQVMSLHGLDRLAQCLANLFESQTLPRGVRRAAKTVESR